MNVPPSKKAELMIVTDQAGDRISQGLHFIQRLAYASSVTFAGDRSGGCDRPGQRGDP